MNGDIHPFFRYEIRHHKHDKGISMTHRGTKRRTNRAIRPESSGIHKVVIALRMLPDPLVVQIIPDIIADRKNFGIHQGEYSSLDCDSPGAVLSRRQVCWPRVVICLDVSN